MSNVCCDDDDVDVNVDVVAVDVESKALMKERQKKDNHNLSEYCSITSITTVSLHSDCQDVIRNHRQTFAGRFQLVSLSEYEIF